MICSVWNDLSSVCIHSEGHQLIGMRVVILRTFFIWLNTEVETEKRDRERDPRKRWSFVWGHWQMRRRADEFFLHFLWFFTFL